MLKVRVCEAYLNIVDTCLMTQQCLLVVYLIELGRGTCMAELIHPFNCLLSREGQLLGFRLGYLSFTCAMHACSCHAHGFKRGSDTLLSWMCWWWQAARFWGISTQKWKFLASSFLKRFTDVPDVPALLRDLHDTESARWRRAWFNYQILTGGKDLMVSVPRAE